MGTEMPNCILCKRTDAKLSSFPGSYGRIISCRCPTCGDYKFTQELEGKLLRTKDMENERFIISGITKDATENEKIIGLTSASWKQLVETAPIPRNTMEYVERLMQILGRKISFLHERLSIDPDEFYPLIYIKCVDDLYVLLEYCKDAGYIILAGGYQMVTITIEGWKYIEKLKTEKPLNPSLAFMAMQYGDPCLESIYNNQITKAVQQAGFVIKRLDERPSAGIIDNRMREQIKNCRFMIADLTNENRGAYWEAGYAEGLGKPVIYMCKKNGETDLKTHFDVNHHMTIIWEEDKLLEAMDILKATIRGTFPIDAKFADE
jgi:hypothetical protein